MTAAKLSLYSLSAAIAAFMLGGAWSLALGSGSGFAALTPVIIFGALAAALIAVSLVSLVVSMFTDRR